MTPDKTDSTPNAKAPLTFSSLGLSEAIIKAVSEMGYTTPTSIQAKSIPPILAGNNIMAAAQTGTGKTAGFVLPILDKLSKGPTPKERQARALVLTPTRELAAQVAQSAREYSTHVSLSIVVAVGGTTAKSQVKKLKNGTDILVATPGRLIDLYQREAVSFDNLEVVVLDEADRMLDMGFIDDIRKLLAKMPKQRQTLLFSATFSPQVRHLAKGIIKNPVEISVTPRNAAAPTVKQCLYPVDIGQKGRLLAHLIKTENMEQVLVFCRTKRGADKLTKFLKSHKIETVVIHGDKSQSDRTRALARFKNKKVRVLVATDVASRGIDIHQLPYVVNLQLPEVPEDYVHRIGRTGRAGCTGNAISLVCAEEIALLREIEQLIKQTIERKDSKEFTPKTPIPDSNFSKSKNRKNKGKRRRY